MRKLVTELSPRRQTVVSMRFTDNPGSYAETVPSGITGGVPALVTEAFLGKVVNEAGAAYNTVLVAIGDELGLYTALAGSGPLSSKELATRTDTAERYIREWCNA